MDAESDDTAQYGPGGRCVRTLFFFFQAEDGIRDYKVTGVQTCALPIYPVEKRVDVFIGVSTLEPVIQQRESLSVACRAAHVRINQRDSQFVQQIIVADRKSTRLNSSHLVISYAVFCLKKKRKQINTYF